MSLHLFSRDAEGNYVLDEKAIERRLVCRAGNPYGLPAKDRSGRLDVTEPPDLGALLAKINTPGLTRAGIHRWPIGATDRRLNIKSTETDMYDLNDAQPQMPPIGELIPDGTFAKVKMTIRPGGVNGSTPMDVGLLKASQTSDAKMLDCEFTVVEGPYARRKFWQNFTVRAASSTTRASRRAGTSPRARSARWWTARSGSIRRTRARPPSRSASSRV